MGGIDCCKLVGNLELGIEGCIISINTSSSTEAITACEAQPVEGPTTATVSITGYADTVMWNDCPAKAGVSLPYVSKYDCDNDELNFIFQGEGQSYRSGPVIVASLKTEFSTSTKTLVASSSSSPASLYTETEQTNGYGLSYTGGPISFSTDAAGTVIDLGNMFSNYELYLQNFTYEASPGQLPIATYSLVYFIGGDVK